MIFSGELPDLVLQGAKTQTRRALVDRKPCLYKPGHSYAVQRTRGGRAVGRIRVWDVHQERIGDISEADAIEEGFASRAEFLLYVTRLWHQPLRMTPAQLRAFLATPVWVISFALDDSRQLELAV